MKPKPHRWIVTESGIVEAYDFNAYKRSNPPPPDHDTPVIPIPCGYFKEGIWIGK